MKTKALIITYYWPPSGGPGVQRWLKLSNYLLENNIKPVIYTPSNPKYPFLDNSLTDLAQKIPSKIRTKKGDFNKKHQLPDFFELYNKNILIFGFGRIGQALAKRCLGFEAKVYVHDPFVNENLIKKNNCQPISKEEGLILADYISIHLPLNNKTKNFISFEEFNKLKQQLIIVNTARGGIINEEALYLALKNNKIRGAGLDVFEKEPPIKNNPLFSLANIILSPHNAALTLECRKRMALELSENIIYYLKKDQRLNKNNLINSNILE